MGKCGQGTLKLHGQKYEETMESGPEKEKRKIKLGTNALIMHTTWNQESKRKTASKFLIFQNKFIFTKMDLAPTTRHRYQIPVVLDSIP